MSNDSIVVLSDDSDDCNEPLSNKKLREDEDCSIVRDDNVSDFEFPVVRLSEINYIRSNKNESRENKSSNSSPSLGSNSDGKRFTLGKSSIDISQNLVTDSLQERDWSDFGLPEVNLESNHNDKNVDDAKKLDNDSDYESQYPSRDVIRDKVNVELSDENEKVVEKKVRKRGKKATQQTDDNDNDQYNVPKPAKKRAPKATSKTNPKDCIKLMEIILDNEVRQYDFFSDLLKAVEENEIKCTVKSQLVPKSITWRRKLDEEDEENSGLNVQMVDENQMVIIWDCEETLKHVSENTFISAISSIKSLMPKKRLTLVMYKMQSYFQYLKSARGQAAQNNPENDKSKKNKAKGLSSYPKISKKQFDENLVEIQLIYDTNSRFIENSEEMVMLIQQYTKSLATLSSKMEKDEKLSEIDWCISVDNRDSVKIDKDGNGLTRLWQQQLCQFAQTSLETSEAIVTVYKSPVQLMEAYAKITQAEGEVLLKDIPIRRNAGILTSSKKIGPELSKKIYIMFTSTDGDVYLNES